MASHVPPNQEKKRPNISISIEETLAYKFKRLCYEERTNASKEIREFIIKFVEERENNAKKK